MLMKMKLNQTNENFINRFLDQLIWTNLAILSIILIYYWLNNDFITFDYYKALGISIYESLLITVFRLIVLPLHDENPS